MSKQKQYPQNSSVGDITADEYQTLLNSFTQAFWETDAAGVVVTDSPSWRAYTGQTLQEWLGEGWTAVVHPDDRAEALCQWQQAVAEGTIVNAEYRLKTRNRRLALDQRPGYANSGT